MTPPPADDVPTGRELRLDIEVPGSPGEVWAAIATGPGISAWFVPTELEERAGGRIVMDFGPGLGQDESRVVAWEPPRRLVAGASPGDPGMAFEWLVEARDGGTCVVRLVQSGFGPDDDRQYDSMRAGWLLFLSNLRLYLRHFRGQPSASVLVHGAAAGPPVEVWPQLLDALGLSQAAEGDRVATGPDAPVLAGVVEAVTGWLLTILIEEPAPGVAFVGAEAWPSGTHTMLYGYFHGPEAAAAAARHEPAWRDWMARRFPGS